MSNIQRDRILGLNSAFRLCTKSTVNILKLPTNSSCVTIEIIHHIPLRVMQEDVYTCGLLYSFNELGENRQISSICYAHNLVVKGMGRT